MTVTIPRIEAALVKAAQIMEFDPTVLPMFERLEKELENEKRDEATRQRARDLIASK